MRPMLRCLFLSFILCVLVGCGRRTEDGKGLPREEQKNAHRLKDDSIGSGEEKTNRVKVEGNVTLDGEKLDGVMVMFLPVRKEQGKPAFGVTNDEGAFELSTSNPGDGAVPGEYKVVVTKNATGSRQSSANKDAPRKAIPKSYSDPSTSSLLIQVKPEGERIQINLHSE